MATFHLILNLAGVVLFAVNFWLRLANRVAGFPVLLSLVTIVLIGISGWLGGELVYVERVGVEQEGLIRESLRRRDDVFQGADITLYSSSP